MSSSIRDWRDTRYPPSVDDSTVAQEARDAPVPDVICPETTEALVTK